MSQLFITKTPQELEAAGFTLVPPTTLEADPQIKINKAKLEKFINLVPGLHVPRNPDGSGGTPPRDHQLRHAYIGLQRRHNCFSWTMGVGKCQKRGTEILMYDGSIKKVEDIVVGDQLMGPDSKPRNVLSLARGKEMMYKITSTKGDEYTVNESHILSLKRSGVSRINGVPSNKWKTGDIENISVREFLKISPSVRKETYKQYKVGIEFSSQEVPIDPYFIGLWLGDGTSALAAVTTVDLEIAEYIYSFAASENVKVRKNTQRGNCCSVYTLTSGTLQGPIDRNPVLKKLKNLNLLKNKHIPDIYKINSREVRLQVLAGLLDSDGHLSNKRSFYEITQKNERLANDIVFLARSLGFAAYVKPVNKFCVYKNKKQEGQYYKISIWGPTQEIPVKLKHKKANKRSDFKNHLVCGISVEPVGIDEYYGFTLDGDHLYLLGNFVVTHNTSLSLLLVYGWYGDHLFKNIDWDEATKLSIEQFEAYVTKNVKDINALPSGSIHIVAPRHTLNKVWMREMQRMGLSGFAEIIDSQSALLNSKAPIFVYHFDFPKLQTEHGNRLRRAGKGFRLKPGGKQYFVGHPIAKLIAKFRKPSLLIVDEVHRLREGTDRTRCMTLIRRKAKKVIVLTGTPMDGWVSQAATIFGFTYGESTRAYPFLNEEFSRKFTKTKVSNLDIATGTETAEEKERPVPGINHMQIPAFLRSTRHLMHRLNLNDEEVRANVIYPPVNTKLIKIPMGFDQQRFYQIIHKNGISSAKQAFASNFSKLKARSNMLSLMQGLRMASVAPWELGFTGNDTELTNTVLSIVQAHKAEGRKGLIGTTFVEESRRIHQILSRAGIDGARIYAQDPNAGKKILKQDDREELIEKFMEDPDCHFLIANKELVAEGLNLAETASYTISCSNGYRANIESQWLARVARPGQQWPVVDSYILLNDGTIDIYVYQLLQAKIAATSALIDLDFSSSVDLTPVDPLELAEMLIAAES